MPKMKSNFRGLVTLLAKNLYPEPDVFIRELIQNAHDGIELRRLSEPSLAGRILLTVDAARRTLEFIDNGIGMDRYVIEEFLSTIGASGTGTMAADLRATGNFDPATIGQFGIGLLSAFVVAERIDIFTRRQGSDQAWHWSNTGDDEYQLEPTSDMPQPGTQVSLTVRPEYSEFLAESRLTAAIRKYADFIPCPVLLNDRGPVNAIHMPWEAEIDRTAHEREGLCHAFLASRYRDRPLLLVPIELPAHRTRGLLYITDQHIPGINTSGFVDIYQNRMCIRHRDAEILPTWAKFVHGLIDSRDLQPTAARDNIHRNDAYYALREALGLQVMHALVRTAQEQPAFFRRLCDWHHFHFKGMALADEQFFENVALHLPFDTTADQLSLTEYRDRMKAREGQRVSLYYFAHHADSERFKEVCLNRKIVAINTGNLFDEQLLRKIAAHSPTAWTLRCLDRLDSRDLYAPLSSEEAEAHAPLVGAMQAEIDDMAKEPVRIVMRRFDPTATPAMLLDARDDTQLEGLKRLLEYPHTRGVLQDLAREVTQALDTRPRDLLVNAANPLVQQLSHLAANPDATVRQSLRALYVIALAHTHERMSPATGTVIREQLQAGIRALLELRDPSAEKEAQTDNPRALRPASAELSQSGASLRADMGTVGLGPTEFRQRIATMTDEDLGRALLAWFRPPVGDQKMDSERGGHNEP